MHYCLSARLAIAISAWLLARAGVKWKIEQPRDKRGRFRPKDGGGYGLPQSIPHHVTDLMHDMGVTQQMYESAAWPLVLPDDLEDVPALEVCMREWILRNMDHWVNAKGRSVAPVMHALMCTWAITLFHYKPPKKMLRRFVQIADEAVGEDLALSRSVVTIGNEQTFDRHDATTPREDRQAVAVSSRIEPYQGVVDYEQADASGHGARAFCPPIDSWQPVLPSAEESALPLGHSEMTFIERGECPRSATQAFAAPDGKDLTWRRGVVAVKSPDPPWRGPPHPPPQPSSAH